MYCYGVKKEQVEINRDNIFNLVRLENCGFFVQNYAYYKFDIVLSTISL